MIIEVEQAWLHRVETGFAEQARIVIPTSLYSPGSAIALPRNAVW